MAAFLPFQLDRLIACVMTDTYYDLCKLVHYSVNDGLGSDLILVALINGSRQ